MHGNSNLQDSWSAKADEFYTLLSMIETELKYYKIISKIKLFFVIAMIRE